MSLKPKKFLIILFLLIISVLFYLKFFSILTFNDIKELKIYLLEKIKQKETLNSNFKTEEYNNNNPDILNINQNNTNPNKNNNTEILENIKKETKEENLINTEKPTQLKYKKIKTPFICQAPKGNWDHLHEEACEEASLLIVWYYSNKKELVLSEEAENDLQKISTYSQDKFRKDDLNISEVKLLAEDYFDLKSLRILDNPKIEDIEKELSLDHLIIAPMAGRKLNNPFFKNPGPLYHMLVIIGYDKNKEIFITADPGTKRGRDFEYSYKTIMDSLHDFKNKKEEIDFGEKRILIF